MPLAPPQMAEVDAWSRRIGGGQFAGALDEPIRATLVARCGHYGITAGMLAQLTPLSSNFEIDVGRLVHQCGLHEFAATTVRNWSSPAACRSQRPSERGS